MIKQVDITYWSQGYIYFSFLTITRTSTGPLHNLICFCRYHKQESTPPETPRGISLIAFILTITEWYSTESFSEAQEF